MIHVKPYNTRGGKCWMMMPVFLFVCTFIVRAQHAIPTDSTVAPFTTIVAGKEYNTSSFHQWLWGKHYRKEWATPVKVPVVLLDTLEGGLHPYMAGGGSQTSTLRLRNKEGKEYVLRSINKDLKKAIPEVYRETFVEDIINDQVSIAHPYAAVTIAPMAEAAKIYHTWPRVVYLPRQPALAEFNENFGNRLFLLEQRPDENWEEADNFGNAKNIIGTGKLLKELKEDPNNTVDALLFLKARLFDMFIGDWGRHEDQWRWAEFERENETIYKPVPRDRDQAYTIFDGLLLKIGLSAAGLGHIEGFHSTIKDVKQFNFPARYLDRRLLNELHLQQWIDAARELRQNLSDSVIENAIRQLPAEVYPLSGEQLTNDLKKRRDQLVSFAEDYYHFLAKEVDVTGSAQKEHFEIERLNNKETRVAIYEITTEGKKEKEPFYSRTFTAEETKELRLYGLAGGDYFHIDGKANDGIRLRVIGGVDEDSIVDESSSGAKILIYDNPGNYIKSASAKLHLDEDTSVNAFQYDAIRYNRKSISPIVFYSNADRLYAGVNYTIEKHKWRQENASKHKLGVRYSLAQNAFNVLYSGQINELIGKWNLSLNAHYDFIKWTNFFGIGNETEELGDDRDFYRMRHHDGFAGIGLNRDIGKHHNIAFHTFFETIKIMDDPERFLAKSYLLRNKDMYDRNNFGGFYAQYGFQYLDDLIMPSKGINFSAVASYTQSLKRKNRSITNYEGYLNFYIPLAKKLVLAVRNGAATLSGEPEFYQLNSIGGTNTLRGFRRDRFWGETTFFNANELQWHFNIKSRLFNGRLALLGLFDNGRVWQGGEISDTWHTSFGAGVLLAPFNKGMISLTLARSNENLMVHLGYGIALDRRD